MIRVPGIPPEVMTTAQSKDEPYAQPRVELIVIVRDTVQVIFLLAAPCVVYAANPIGRIW